MLPQSPVLLVIVKSVQPNSVVGLVIRPGAAVKKHRLYLPIPNGNEIRVAPLEINGCMLRTAGNTIKEIPGNCDAHRNRHCCDDQN